MTSERVASSLARPPALRITCASPSRSPANWAGSRWASMQIRIAKRRTGGRGQGKASASSELAGVGLGGAKDFVENRHRNHLEVGRNKKAPDVVSGTRRRKDS